MLVLTWIRKRPGSIHIADVGGDAHCQDAVHQGDQATVPFVTPRPIHVTQDEVERDPKQEAQKRDNQKHCHLPFCRQGKNKQTKRKQLKTYNSSFQRVVCKQSSRQLNHITWWGNTAEEHILLCGIAYSRNGQLLQSQVSDCAVLCVRPTIRLCLKHNSTLVSKPRVWWGEGAVSSSAVTFVLGGATVKMDMPTLTAL